MTETTTKSQVPPGITEVRETFARGLADLINRNNIENGSNTPDFILAAFIDYVVQAFDIAVRARAEWYGRMDEPGRQWFARPSRYNADLSMRPEHDPRMDV